MTRAMEVVAAGVDDDGDDVVDSDNDSDDDGDGDDVVDSNEDGERRRRWQ